MLSTAAINIIRYGKLLTYFNPVWQGQIPIHLKRAEVFSQSSVRSLGDSIFLLLLDCERVVEKLGLMMHNVFQLF